LHLHGFFELFSRKRRNYGAAAGGCYGRRNFPWSWPNAYDMGRYKRGYLL